MTPHSPARVPIHVEEKFLIKIANTKRRIRTLLANRVSKFNLYSSSKVLIKNVTSNDDV